MSEQQPARSKPRSARGVKEAQRLFQLGPFWLANVSNSPFIYRCWYDEGTGRTRRVSTGTADLEEAKLALAKLVLTEPPQDPLNPAEVPLVSIKAFYMEHHGNKTRSKAGAERAFKLVLSYLKTVAPGTTPRAGDFSLARQESFMRWCNDKHALSCKSISTYLSTIKAAYRFAARPRIIRDARGREREVRIISEAPYIEDSEAQITKVTGLARSTPREWIPTDKEMAQLIDAIEHEQVFRYVVMALNTWARPEAITELSVKAQVNFERGLVVLNPPGRVQNKKVRPTIRLTDNLKGWLLYWNLDRPIVENGIPVGKIDNRTLKKAARRAGIANARNFTRYTIRHFMATRVRKVDGVQVSREQRAEWMGHVDPDHSVTQNWYESFDPDYLEAPAKATDQIIRRLDSMCQRRLWAPNVEQKSGFTVIQANG
jgi:integrase